MYRSLWRMFYLSSIYHFINKTSWVLISINKSPRVLIHWIELLQILHAHHSIPKCYHVLIMRWLQFACTHVHTMVMCAILLFILSDCDSIKLSSLMDCSTWGICSIFSCLHWTFHHYHASFFSVKGTAYSVAYHPFCPRTFCLTFNYYLANYTNLFLLHQQPSSSSCM